MSGKKDVEENKKRNCGNTTLIKRTHRILIEIKNIVAK